MDTKDLAAMVAAFTAEQASLQETIRKADLRLTKVRSVLALLNALDSDEAPKFDGKLADAIRAVLRQHSDRSMSPLEVRDTVKALGYEHPDEANLVPAIHGVLKRLVESRDARTKTGKNGSARYQWLGANERTTTTFVPDRLPNSGLYANLIPEHLQATLERMANNPKLDEQLEQVRQISDSMSKSGIFKAAEAAEAAAARLKLSEVAPTGEMLRKLGLDKPKK